MWWWSSERKKRRALSQALENYPIYAPPHHGEGITRQQGRENYAYFLVHKAERVEDMLAFLRHFSIECDLSPSDIVKIGDWLWEYGEFLLPGRGYPECILSASNYEPPFSGPFHGLNVINDIGIYIGNYLVIKGNGRLYWELYANKKDKDMHYFLHPCVSGLDPIIGGCVANFVYGRDTGV
ncbi:hypothetical protein Ms3S1_p20610 (plasmid) [Methylosinus sp. 3S-1]